MLDKSIVLTDRASLGFWVTTIGLTIVNVRGIKNRVSIKRDFFTLCDLCIYMYFRAVARRFLHEILRSSYTRCSVVLK